MTVIAIGAVDHSGAAQKIGGRGWLGKRGVHNGQTYILELYVLVYHSCNS